MSKEDARNRAHELPKSEFASMFGMSEKQLERYCQEGMPHKKRGTRVFIVMPEGRVWYHKHLVAKGEKKGAPTDVSAMEKRELGAKVEKAEIELARLRGQLMTVADYDRVVGDAMARCAARLKNLPPRIAGVVLGATSIQEAQARVEPLVREVMDELRAADDVPTSDGEEDAAA